MRFRHLATAGLTAVALAGCGLGPMSAISAPLQSTLERAAPSAASIASAAGAAPSSPAPAVSREPKAAASTAPAAPSEPASPSAAPAVPIAPIPVSARLGRLGYIRQALNNCGPAAIAEVLRYWGIQRTQGQVQAVLRPDSNSRGMMPYPVPAYVRGLGMSALMGVGGSDALVKALVGNGFPVIVSQWVSATDHEAHYREIEGFDDRRSVFVSTDSYLGPNHQISYAEFDQIWGATSASW